MDTFKKIFYLSFNHINNDFVITLVVHIIAAILLAAVPRVNLYVWAGLVILVLNKFGVFDAKEVKEEAPAEEKTEE